MAAEATPADRHDRRALVIVRYAALGRRAPGRSLAEHDGSATWSNPTRCVESKGDDSVNHTPIRRMEFQ